jgi:hypothetical protein
MTILPPTNGNCRLQGVYGTGQNFRQAKPPHKLCFYNVSFVNPGSLHPCALPGFAFTCDCFALLLPIEDFMEVQLGDWVKTESGDLGKVVHISRLTIFVTIDVLGDKRVYPFLESQLTRIDPLSLLASGIVATAQNL